MLKLVVLTCFVASTFACKGAWDNTCRSGECCPGNFCDNNNGAWAVGVCKPGNEPARAAPAPVPAGTGGNDCGQGAPSFDQFKNAVTSNGYPAPSQDQYNTFARLYADKGGITSKRELAMFLAEILHESGGLRYKKELACEHTGCPGSYVAGGEPAGKHYYGRGYIQLSWIYNYREASQALYGNDRLVQDPDFVGNTEEGAWGTAFWFWKARVHNAAGVQQGQFGSATRAINGGLECGNGPNVHLARQRFEMYKKVLNAFGCGAVQANEQGCYN